MRRYFIAIFISLVGTGILAIGGIGVALALENQDSFCASCHTEPETTFHQRSIQIKSPDLAAYHTKQNTHCIDCHTPSGLLGRASGLRQGVHDLANFIRGNYHSPAVTTNPLGDDACVKCHTKIYDRPPGSGKAGMNHYHFYLLQWKESSTNAASCIDCHAPHALAQESLKFMNQGKVGQLCEDCHTALSGVIR